LDLDTKSETETREGDACRATLSKIPTQVSIASSSSRRS
jgi:hypothetical protein